MRRCRFFFFLSGSPLTRYLIHAHAANSRIVFMPHYGVMIQPYTVSIVLIEIIGVVCTTRTSENVVISFKINRENVNFESFQRFLFSINVSKISSSQSKGYLKYGEIFRSKNGRGYSYKRIKYICSLRGLISTTSRGETASSSFERV